MNGDLTGPDVYSKLDLKSVTAWLGCGTRRRMAGMASTRRRASSSCWPVSGCLWQYDVGTMPFRQAGAVREAGQRLETAPGGDCGAGRPPTRAGRHGLVGAGRRTGRRPGSSAFQSADVLGKCWIQTRFPLVATPAVSAPARAVKCRTSHARVRSLHARSHSQGQRDPRPARRAWRQSQVRGSYSVLCSGGSAAPTWGSRASGRVKGDSRGCGQSPRPGDARDPPQPRRPAAIRWLLQVTLPEVPNLREGDGGRLPALF